MRRTRSSKTSQSRIRTKYVNGKYYNARPFTYNGIPVQLREEITATDGENIHAFIQKHHSRMYYLKWDDENKRFYSDFFILPLPLMGKMQLP